MNVLYLTEDYFESKVHNNLLVSELEQSPELHLFVFSPRRGIRTKDLSPTYREHERLTVIAPQIDISIHLYRYDYWAKIRCKLRLLERNLSIIDIDAIHSATLFADGGVAYRLFKKYHIPYFVSVRGSDSYFYARRMFHLWPMANRIISQAAAITFVASAIKNQMLRYKQFAPSKKKLFQSPIITNGIDTVWTKNLNLSQVSIHKPVHILYIGRFDKNKNVLALTKAVLQLSLKQKNIFLSLVGGNGEEHQDVINMVEQHKYCMEYLGEIYDKSRLMSVVRSCDIFAMVSHCETFGLVYAECLTQGLPLVYTQGTGFDEMYPQGFVGYAVDSRSVQSITNGIQSVINRYDELRSNIAKIDCGQFSWSKIAQRYLSLYKRISDQSINRNSTRSKIKSLYYKILYFSRKPLDKFNHNMIHKTCRIGKNVSLKQCNVGMYSYISSGCKLFNTELGNYCCLGPGTDTGGMQHSYWWYSMSPVLSDECRLPERTIIGNDVWIGSGCIIKQGIRIGDGAVVGANSFVNKDVEPFSIVVGSPARHLKYRFEKDVQIAIIESHYWEKEPYEARLILDSLGKL